MRLTLLVAPVVALCAACASPEDAARAAVVYGEDGRTEIYAHPNAALRGVAETAIAMRIDADNLDESDPDDIRLDYTRTLGEARSLCAGEPFEDQLEPGTCSGTLIDSRHLLTAGHCMDSGSDCEDDVWLFNFRYVADGVLETMTSDDVYRCAGVLGYFDDDRVDHAIVRLDRDVVGHAPPTLRVERAGLAVDTPLALIGHPNGIPMKIDSGGVLTVNSSDVMSFEATVDAFNANSGSGVFDHAGGLIGLLRGGETDYVDNGGCNIVNVIDPPPTDDGENLVYLHAALDAFCNSPGVTSTACDCDGPCVPALPADECADATEILPVSQTLNGSLDGYRPLTAGSCGGLGPERVYTFTLDEPATFVARSQGYDSVLYLRAGCEGSQIDCNDDIDRDTDRGSRIEANLLPGDYALFLDAYGLTVGSFTLTLSFTGEAPDAGAPDSGGAIPDAGVAPDAGPPASLDAGCGCHVGGRPNAGWPMAALSLLVLLGRRRRRIG